MNTKKLAIGLSIAGGALFAAWLLTGERKKITKNYVVKKTNDLKQTLKKDVKVFDDSEVHYL